MSLSVPVDLLALRRRLWLYRLLSLVLALSLGALLVAVRLAMVGLGDPEVEVFDVPARFEALARDNPDSSDVSQTYFTEDTASVHMHVMGRGQACPLHIHRRSHEATIIVTGQAEVRQVWGDGEGLAHRVGVHGPGELIASPPFTGHAWFNRAPDRMLGNLVFSWPPFDGNLYVDGEDARMRTGTAPFVHVPAAVLPSLREGVREERLPALDGRMSSVLLASGVHALAASRKAPVVVYVAEGEGAIEAPDARPVKPGQLWVLRRDATLRAEPGHPLALYVFRPGA
ncbi:cupin domain-containing protein [Pyxidicoccus caerfyrddinensis]|jgi:hypothetical protein|uniref:cupin domain-containing protein n=1 Tax=Pyxidicoccus caerfyrddinensis TaxID=2709663 RepID=UPI0013DA5075|nr:cupin domain-containing protein [Pyxidicoccus caerfyrddinensis]